MAVNDKKFQLDEQVRCEEQSYKEATNDIFVDEELNKELKLKLKLDNKRYRIHEIPSSRKISEVRRDIEQSLSKHNHCTHLVAHGKPGKLNLGTGITVEELEKLPNETKSNSEHRANKSSIVIWGCEVGKGRIIRQKHKHTTLHISDQKLGLGKSLQGYGELTAVIANSKTTLSSSQWKSKGNNIVSESGPVLNKKKNLWVLQAIGETEFGKKIKGLGLQLTKNLPINGKFESNNKNFKTWSLVFNPSKNELGLKLPESLINANRQDFKVTIEGKGKKITSWNAILKPNDISLPIIQWVKKVNVAYDPSNKSYNLNGRLKIQNLLKSNAGLQDIRIKRSKSNQDIPRWNIDGKITQVIPAIGLKKNSDIGIDYNNKEKTLTIKSITFNSKTRKSLISGDVEAQNIIFARNASSGWSPKNWQASGTLGFKPTGLSADGNISVRYQSANGATPESYTIDSF